MNMQEKGQDERQSERTVNRGKVWLVGAGPGDAGLLTLRGREVLEKAQSVVYDALVGDGILGWIPEGAEQIYVGKRGGSHTKSQEEINQILVEEAEKGRRVVRLKGGDPFVFGRGSEEALVLREHGIPFEVVCGVTSAVAVPAACGIPVTHRGMAPSFHVITGHRKNGEPAHMDYSALAREGGTLIFLMGVTSAETICRGLIEGGMDRHTPAALLEKGTTAGQRRVLSTLERLWEDGKSQNIKPPAIIVVGEVCSLSESLQWMEEKPLFGAKILVTRPKRRSAGMAGRLREAGAEVVELPAAEPRLLEDTSFLDRTLERLADFRWAVFTSPSGVELFFEYLRREKKDIRPLMGLKFAVIGAGTAKALCRYGFYADYMPENFYAKELGRGLAETILHEMKEEEKRGENGRGGAGCGKPVKVLLLRAQKASPALCEELARAEIPFEDAVLYRTEFPAPSMQAERVKILLEKKAFDYVTFTSESTVKGFLELLSPTDEELCGFTAVCIGEMTEKAAREAGMRTVTSEVPSMDSMAECMISLQSVRA